ncbi:hypothetical protein LFM09_44870 [Lentzea alba]|uniref:hypothetical protein n=1 Tax=Lentzea alba TaxID=2714351 RepID=UPI0039BF36CF
MTERVVWPSHRSVEQCDRLADLRRHPDVRVRALSLLTRWARPGTGRDELAIMMTNAVEITALRALLDQTR